MRGLWPDCEISAAAVATKLASQLSDHEERASATGAPRPIVPVGEQLVDELIAMGQRADRIFSALADALPGKTLAGRCKLEARIGTGGFSVVFRATHADLQRAVAVKIFCPQAGNDSAAALERFRFEGMASSVVRHPNIVHVLDAGISDDGIPYIVMELLEGKSFDTELAAGVRLPLARIAQVMAPVCHALAAAHAGGVIHRDVKPENIMSHRAETGDVVKLLDFGIAKVTGVGHRLDAQLTSTGMFLGTPDFMAPERFLGEECTSSADVYSVGVILYRAITGKLPYVGTLPEVMMQAVSERPIDVRELVTDLPHEIAEVTMRSLSEAPGARPSAAELAAVLDRVAPSTAGAA